jgi:hypothetical protein
MQTVIAPAQQRNKVSQSSGIKFAFFQVFVDQDLSG